MFTLLQQLIENEANTPLMETIDLFANKVGSTSTTVATSNDQVYIRKYQSVLHNTSTAKKIRGNLEKVLRQKAKSYSNAPYGWKTIYELADITPEIADARNSNIRNLYFDPGTIQQYIPIIQEFIKADTRVNNGIDLKKKMTTGFTALLRGPNSKYLTHLRAVTPDVTTPPNTSMPIKLGPLGWHNPIFINSTTVDPIAYVETPCFTKFEGALAHVFIEVDRLTRKHNFLPLNRLYRKGNDRQRIIVNDDNSVAMMIDHGYMKDIYNVTVSVGANKVENFKSTLDAYIKIRRAFGEI